MAGTLSSLRKMKHWEQFLANSHSLLYYLNIEARERQREPTANFIIVAAKKSPTNSSSTQEYIKRFTLTIQKVLQRCASGTITECPLV